MRLIDHFHIGQLVTACVISNNVSSEKNKNRFAKIELSLRPSLINASLVTTMKNNNEKNLHLEGACLPVTVVGSYHENVVECSFSDGVTLKALLDKKEFVQYYQNLKKINKPKSSGNASSIEIDNSLVNS